MMNQEEIKVNLEKLKSELNFKSIRPPALPDLDLEDISKESDQGSHNMLIQKLLDYSIKQGNMDALNFIQRKIQEHAFKSKKRDLADLIEVPDAVRSLPAAKTRDSGGSNLKSWWKKRIRSLAVAKATDS